MAEPRARLLNNRLNGHTVNHCLNRRDANPLARQNAAADQNLLLLQSEDLDLP